VLWLDIKCLIIAANILLHVLVKVLCKAVNI